MQYINKNITFKNPILTGFHPDPSVCRVNDDYYLVTSSFTYFPGIPIFHSKDLINWNQIGHVLDRPSQLNLGSVGHSRGIFAPTIRYNEGVYYLITTNVDGGGNFIVTTEDPAKSWSDPYWLLDAPGIDPSLFFDDDGKVYYTGTRPSSTGEKYPGDWEIWLQEIDLQQMKLIGEKYTLWKGAMVDVIWPEGPHLYKKNGYYYIMISEGGTGREHAITIARSEMVTGPFEGYSANPILTHRHLGKGFPIVNVGHGDLINTQNDEWWIVLLASRPYGGSYCNLGRETFLAPLTWEDGWPVISPGTGKVESSYPVPDLPEHQFLVDSATDNFDNKTLDYKWNTLRSSIEKDYDLETRPGHLRLYLKEEKLTELKAPSFIGRRQEHINFSAMSLMEFTPENECDTAGLVLLQSNEFHFRFLRTKHEKKQYIELIKCSEGVDEVIVSVEYELEKIFLKIEAYGQDYSFYYGNDSKDMKILKRKVDGRILSTDVAGGFVGTYIGMYASSNGKKSENYADYDWFEYQGLLE